MFHPSAHHHHGALMQVGEARPLIEEQEAERYVNNESVTREAIQAVEQDGAALGGRGGGAGWGRWSS